MAHGFRFVPQKRTATPATLLRCGHCGRVHPPSRCRPVGDRTVFCWCVAWPEDPVPGVPVMDTRPFRLERR